MTIFCSSMRKARMIRCRTAPADRQPPYARVTFLCRFDRVASLRGLQRKDFQCDGNTFRSGGDICTSYQRLAEFEHSPVTI